MLVLNIVLKKLNLTRLLGRWKNMLWTLLVFAFISSASGHGGMLWPPIWQDGYGVPIDQLFDHYVTSKPDWSFWTIRSHPNVRDPINDRAYINPKTWATDQAYTGGIGPEFEGTGPLTNDNNENLPEQDRCYGECVTLRQPWAAPGRTPSLGGGESFICVFQTQE